MKISVIVPAYNAEETLRRCMDSLLDQTLRDMEILTVDNGSTDGSRAILESYAARDSRVRVIHKEGGGVSSARNAGLAAATGEWIGWVDADDWIEPDMFECLLKSVLENGADIGICGWFEHAGAAVDGSGTEQFTCLSTEQALGALLADRTVKNHLWNKLWKAELFEGVRFPDRWHYEDVSTVYRLFEKAKKTVFLPDKKYHHVYSPNSLIEDKSLTAEMDYFAAVCERFEALSPTWPQFSAVMEEQVMSAAVTVWDVCGRSGRAERKRNRDRLRAAAAFSREHSGSELRRTRQGRAGKMRIWLTQYANLPAFWLTGWIKRLYRLRPGNSDNEK